jgi:hypothetical protein
MRLRKHEIRISVTKNLYDRIAQEAKIRDTKMATVAREKLAKHYIPQEKLVSHHEVSNTFQDNNVIHAKLIKIEKQLSSADSRIDSLLDLSQEQMRFVITMIDWFYFDLMKYLPDIPEEFTHVAEATAKLRHSRWLEMIKNNMEDYE